MASAFSRAEPFSRESLLRRAEPSMTEGASQQALLDNRSHSADELGGVSFSTYNWDFAPYMFYLKQRISQHNYPPAAFMWWGIIEGKTVLQFTIHRDGRLTSMHVLNSEGHESLKETALLAVQSSADFRALPQDFPEDSLVVTGDFRYTIIRDR